MSMYDCPSTSLTILSPARPSSVHASVDRPSMPAVKLNGEGKQAETAEFKAPLAAISPNKARDNTSRTSQSVKNGPKTATPSKSRIPVHSDASTITTKANESKVRSPVPASPARKAKKEIKIFKDPAPPQATSTTSNVIARGLNSNQASATPSTAETTSSSSTSSSSKPGLRPLLLRADSAQGLRAPAKSFIDGNPLMSTPTKKFGQAANAWSASNNASAASSRVLDVSATPRKTAVNRVSSVAQTRDSKELRSPESIKTQKSAVSMREQDKENSRASPARSSPVSKESPKNARGFFKSKSALGACEFILAAGPIT